MKRFVFLYVLSLTFFVNQAQDPVSNLAKVNEPRVRNIDVKHIALDLHFNWKKKQAYGTAAITFSPLKENNKITLDAGLLTINSVQLNEKELKFNYDGGDKNDGLEITLDRAYKPEEEISIVIAYHTNWINEIDPTYLSGTNGKGLRFSEPTFNDPVKPKEIWSIGEPESNRYWFPCYDAPDDLRTTEFTGTVDKKLKVISNGDLIRYKDNTDGTCTFHWKANIPYANHLTSFTVGEYFDVQENYKKIMLHNWGSPKEVDWIAASVERLSDMIAYFENVTGVKYPYPEYSQVFVQDIGTFTSNNGMATISENMIDDKPTHADYFYLWDLTEAEALAQQWYGNYITAGDWRDVWLNKSFAHYFNELYNKQKNGSAEYLLYQHSFDHTVYLNDWNNGYRHPIVTKKYDDATQFTTDNYASVRGSLVLNMLRKHLGEEKWWKAIVLYTKANAGKLVSTNDFLKAVEEASGEKMQWFFDQWLYKMGHPVFEITKNYDQAKKQLILTVKQNQKIDVTNQSTQVEFFKGKIEIEIDGKIEQVWLEAKAINDFAFSCAKQPRLVNFDFESTWIKEITFQKTFDELVYELKNSKDLLAKQYAMVELGTLAKNEKTSPEIKTKIKTELRTIILSKNYWRFKNAAMLQLRHIIGSEKIDSVTIQMLLTVIKNDRSWVKASAISFLGLTKDQKFTGLYLTALNDVSDRVINAAAVALGKTKDPRAFEALKKLVTKPSMKSQSLLSALGGLKELGDQRAFEIAIKALSDLKLPRWRLPDGSVWDFRIIAAQTIASLGKAEEAYPLIFERLKISMDENDLNGIFNNVLIIKALADPKGLEAFDILKIKFKDDVNTLAAVDFHESLFKETLKNK